MQRSGQSQVSSRAVAVPSSHIQELRVENFTVFKKETFQFSPHLNLILGENGTGKSHLLKLVYSSIAASVDGYRKYKDKPPSKELLQNFISEKLNFVFKPEKIGNLVSQSNKKKNVAQVETAFYASEFSYAFNIQSTSETHVNIQGLPGSYRFIGQPPVFIPTRELLTLYPNFVSIYENHFFEFEETYRDLCVLLGIPPLKELNPKLKALVDEIETILGARVILDQNGKFYLQNAEGKKTEMFLIAEGMRKMAMIAYLIMNGSLQNEACLFWDEPESNLNPKLIKVVAKIIYVLSTHGIQMFIATHSLFLMRELEILHMNNPYQTSLQTKVIALESTKNRVKVHQSDSFDDMPVIVSLDEELEQSVDPHPKVVERHQMQNMQWSVS